MSKTPSSGNNPSKLIINDMTPYIIYYTILYNWYGLCIWGTGLEAKLLLASWHLILYTILYNWYGLCIWGTGLEAKLLLASFLPFASTSTWHGADRSIQKCTRMDAMHCAAITCNVVTQIETTSKAIVMRAFVCNVRTCVDEIKHGRAVITCDRQIDPYPLALISTSSRCPWRGQTAGSHCPQP